MRKELEGRPLIWLALAFMGGLASQFYPVFAFVGLGCLVVDRRASFWALGLGFAILGVVMAPRVPSLITEPSEFSGEVVVVHAPRPTQSGERAVVATSGQRVVMYYDAGQDVSFGDTLLVQGRVRPLTEKSREYWRHQQVSGSLNVRGTITRVSRGPPFFAWGQGIRLAFVDYTRETLGQRARAIVQSVCFNHDVELSDEEREALSRSGIIHIISTSGMHVVLVAGFLSLLLSALPMPRWCQMGILMLLLLVYGAAASFRPPMVRSIFMAGFWAFAYLFKREADGLSATAASAIITLLIMPHAIFDVGFLLSFVAITSLVMFVPEAGRHVNTALGWIALRAKQSALASTVASLAAAPLLSLSFRQFSIIGVVTNLIVAPLIPVIVSVSILAWLVKGPVGAFCMQVVVEPLALFCSGVAGWISNLPFAAIETPEIPPWFVIGFYVFAAMLWRPKPRPTFRRPVTDGAL
ncbi:MAG: ComEC/Rec2 family competence protein [Chthonomonas sp.]|nr:ComEC/Rec2 family competence protein [Chthonomonas sp.]